MKKATMAMNDKVHGLSLTFRDKMYEEDDAAITELEMLENDD